MRTQEVHCGYIPLVDCAPLIIAKELQFASEEGLELVLVRQPSWSALRDRLIFGQIQFAHMLSPLPIAMSLGLSGPKIKTDALMVLSANGTMIGISAELDQKLTAAGWINDFASPDPTLKAIAAVTKQPLRVGVPFAFSMHRMLLEYWLRHAPDLHPDLIEIVTIPPPQMAEAVKSGRIDMFCVGEPWGTVAVQQSGATLILPSTRIWEFAPEKVLAVRNEWGQAHEFLCDAMIRAIHKAGKWLNDPQNLPLAVEILARSQHLDLPLHAIEPALSGQIVPKLGTQPHHVDNLLMFHASATNFPWRSQACWIAERLAHWHDLDPETARQVARDCFRTDTYRDALAMMGADMPGASEKVEGALAVPTAVASTRGKMILGPDRFFDDAVFDFSPAKLSKN
ncbi:CmpA/NrtA family ABC transporter substrate-binding protein [Algirhabdus cladophorae]|uniref:CmpA/NrtA family ABC transporter substrate-binding protein n=1 Tax=Algirhabdus cladophorae TaxID=3377108 RepID=UPI003B847EDA